MRTLPHLALGLAVAFAAACGSNTNADFLSATNSYGGTTGSAGTTGDAGAAGTGDPTEIANGVFPCEVATLLATRCLGCHSDPPRDGAPMALTTPAAFAAASESYDGQTVADVSLTRMKATKSPMPPKPAEVATADEIAAFEAWVNEGMPTEVCDTTLPPPAPSPYDTPEVCTSGTKWTGGNHESPFMRPGNACITCHEQKDGPTFTFAGTVFPTAHEPDNCNGVGSVDGVAAKIQITDAKGTVYTMTANKVGNFYGSAKGALMPYTAKVIVGDKEREMTTPAESGDCNSCHTLEGTEGAPGRIMLP
jgi:hypothetical protein